MRGEDISPELLLEAYRQGVFPMAESRNDPEVFWVDPKRRGIIPIDGFHVSRSLARTLRLGQFRAQRSITVNQVRCSGPCAVYHEVRARDRIGLTRCSPPEPSGRIDRRRRSPPRGREHALVGSRSRCDTGDRQAICRQTSRCGPIDGWHSNR